MIPFKGFQTWRILNKQVFKSSGEEQILMPTLASKTFCKLICGDVVLIMMQKEVL